MKVFFIIILSVVGLPTPGFGADNATVSAEGLRDIRSPVSFPANYMFLLAVLFILLIVGFSVFIYSKYKRKPEIKEDPADTRSAWEIAYTQLEQLAKTSYLSEGRFKEYYSELSGIVRYYFENRFEIRAPEMTTEEFLWSLERSGGLTGVHKETLKKFMASCDIIKFAKHIPRVEEAGESFRFARQIVDETKGEDGI